MAGERVGHSLQATALVNEAFVRLADGKAVAWNDRHIFWPSQHASCDESSWTTRVLGSIKNVAATP